MKHQILKTAVLCCSIYGITTGCRTHYIAAQNAAASGDSISNTKLNNTINRDTMPSINPDSMRRDRTDTSHRKF